MTLFSSPVGTLQLQRYPTTDDPSLQAWDAADSYLLQQLLQQPGWPAARRIGICNDRFGALSLATLQALAARPGELLSFSDSWLAQEALRRNAAANGYAADLATGRLQLCDSLAEPDKELDIVLIKIPKSLAFLEDQLCRLRPALRTDSLVLAGALCRHLAPGLNAVLEDCIGPCQASLAWKKARLFQARVSVAPRPVPAPTDYLLSPGGVRLRNHANLFSRTRLDGGSALLLQQLDQLPAATQVIDLACGNGVLGLLYARRHPAARLLFIDESHMALASAQLNATELCGSTALHRFIAGDGLSDCAAASAELILCNPPFHQQHEVGDDTAWRMLRHSRRVLKKNGCLCLVGNRHLGYHSKLKRLFGNCQLLASDARFVVLLARKA